LHAGGQGFESPRLHQPNTIKGFRDSAPPEGSQKADAHLETDFQAALGAFLLSRRVANYSPRSVTSASTESDQLYSILLN